MSIVSLIDFNEQDDTLEKALEDCLSLTDFHFDDARKVVIKPNMCYYWDYSTGETTDPRFVGTLVDIIRKRLSSQVKISVVESDASAMKCQYAFTMLGYRKMAKEKRVELVNLTKDQTEYVKVKVGKKVRQFSIPRTIAEADVLINVPKIKYMSKVQISCALKNIYGCNPYPYKYKLHKWLDEAIVGLNKIMKTNLCVVDGIVVRGMSTLRLGLVMGSTDPVAIDVAASEIVGINPKTVGYIMLASREKLGNISFVTKGENLDYYKRLFPRRTITHKARSLLSTFYNRLVAG